MNIYKILSGGDDISWILANICDFTNHKHGIYYIHTEYTPATIRKKIRKEGIKATISQIKDEGEENLPDQVVGWIAQDATQKSTKYVRENKDEICDKILDYLITEIQTLLQEAEEMREKGG